MLLFLDESYQATNTGHRLVVGGLLIPAGQYRALMALVHALKQEWFVSDEGVDTTDQAAVLSARRGKILVKGEIDLAELHGRNLLAEKAVRYHQTTGAGQGWLLCERLLEECFALGALPFAVLSEPEKPEAILHPEGWLPREYAFILERVDRYVDLYLRERMITVGVDTIHRGRDSRLVREMANFLFRTKKGKAMRHVVPAPFCVDSATSAGIQVADVISYLLLRSMGSAEERRPWQPLIDRIRDAAVRDEAGRLYSLYRIHR